MINNRKAIFVLFLEGFASSGIQMISIRQNAPFVGNSVLTTSIIISVFLAALALGYYRGGQYCKEKYVQKLNINLILSIGLFGVGLSYTFISSFYSMCDQISQHIPYMGNPLVQLSLYCLLVMSPLVYCLGQTVPLLLHCSKNTISKSKATGNATAISTVGNVIGALLTSLVMMYFIGVGYAIFINAALLALCLAITLQPRTRRLPISLAAVPILLVIAFYLNITLPQERFLKTTAYSNYELLNESNGKTLLINNSRASHIQTKTRQAWHYIELFKMGLLSEKVKGKDILVLGAGGFTFSAQSSYGANITYVDIDPSIQSIAENHLLEEPIKGRFVAQDARFYLLQNDNAWDIIIIDLFTRPGTIPLHASTFEFFQLAGSKLKDNGVVAINITGDPTLNDTYTSRMDYTIRQALAQCITDITSYKDITANILYFCKKRDQLKKRVPVYSDNNTQAAIDSYLSQLRGKKPQ